MSAVLLAALLHSLSAAQPSSNLSVTEFVSALESLDSAAHAEADCLSVYEQAETLNAPSLFLGATYCFGAERPVEAASLLHFGQVRSVTDLFLSMESVDSQPEIAELYSLLYFQFGGTADMTVWADTGSATSMIEDLETWAPQLTPDYQPGWPRDAGIEPASYFEIIEDQRGHRLQQLRVLARLGQNERYVEISSELSALQAANPGGFTAGTPDAERSSEIVAEMAVLYDAASQE